MFSRSGVGRFNLPHRLQRRLVALPRMEHRRRDRQHGRQRRRVHHPEAGWCAHNRDGLLFLVWQGWCYDEGCSGDGHCQQHCPRVGRPGRDRLGMYLI